MDYDNPFRDATVVEVSDPGGAIYYAISENEEYDRVMSPGAYEAIEEVICDWFKQPGALCCRLHPKEHDLLMYISAPDSDEHIASFKLPLAELVLAAAINSEESHGIPPSHISAALRQLADQIDDLSKKD